MCSKIIGIKTLRGRLKMFCECYVYVNNGCMRPWTRFFANFWIKVYYLYDHTLATCNKYTTTATTQLRLLLQLQLRLPTTIATIINIASEQLMKLLLVILYYLPSKHRAQRYLFLSCRLQLQLFWCEHCVVLSYGSLITLCWNACWKFNSSTCATMFSF